MLRKQCLSVLCLVLLCCAPAWSGEVTQEEPNGLNRHTWSDGASNRGQKLYELSAQVKVPQMKVDLHLYYKDVEDKRLYLNLHGFTSEYGEAEKKVVEVPLKGNATRKGKCEIPGYAHLYFSVDMSDRVRIKVKPESQKKREMSSFLNLFNLFSK